MKRKFKLMALITIVAMVMSLVPAVGFAAEGDVVCETFDSFPINASTGRPASYETVIGSHYNIQTGDAGPFSITTDETTGNKYLTQTLIKANYNERAAWIGIKDASKVATERYQVAEFDVQIGKDNSTTYASIFLDANGTGGHNAANRITRLMIWQDKMTFSFSEDNATEIRPNYGTANKGKGSYIKFSDYGIKAFNVANKEFKNFKMIWDTEKKLFDLIIDGKLVLADTETFYTATPSQLRELEFNTCGDVGDTTSIDNFRIYGVTDAEANALVKTGLDNLIGSNPEALATGDIRLPYTGTLGAKTATSNASYAYALKTADSRITIENNYYTTYAGDDSAVKATSLPTLPTDNDIDTALNIMVTKGTSSETYSYPIVVEAPEVVIPSLKQVFDVESLNVRAGDAITLPATVTSAGVTYDVAWAATDNFLAISGNTATALVNRNQDIKSALKATFSVASTEVGTKNYSVKILADAKVVEGTEQQIAFEDFANATENKVLSQSGASFTGGDGLPWTVFNSKPAELSVSLVKDPTEDSSVAFADSNKVIKLERTAAATATNFARARVAKDKDWTPITGSFAISMDLYMDPSYNGQFYVDVRSAEDASEGRTLSSTMLASTMFNYQGRVAGKYYDTTTDKENKLGQVTDKNYPKFELGKWVNVQLVFNMDNRLYDVYVDGKKVNSQPWTFYRRTVADREAANAIDNVTWVCFDMSKTSDTLVGTGSVYIDNFRMFRIATDDCFDISNVVKTQDTITSFDVFDRGSLTNFDGEVSQSPRTAFVAVYKDNKLVDAKTAAITTTEKSLTQTIIVNEQIPDGAVAKAFIWNDGKLLPLTKAVTLN